MRQEEKKKKKSGEYMSSFCVTHVREEETSTITNADDPHQLLPLLGVTF